MNIEAAEVVERKNGLQAVIIYLWEQEPMKQEPGNTKGGSVTVPLISCLTGLESAV